MTDLTERVASAMWASRGNAYGFADTENTALKAIYRNLAEAALAAIDPAAIRAQALREAAECCRDLARPIMGGVMQDRLGTQTRKVGEKAKARALVNAARLIEALIDQPAPGAKIKPLEWVKGAARSEIATYVVAEADNDDDPFWFVYINGGSAGKLGEHRTEDAAKAAAEADYERRVRSAIRED